MTVVARQNKYVRLAQLDRAFGYGPKGREFESSNARKGKPRKLNGLRGFLLSKYIVRSTYLYVSILVRKI